MFDQIGNMPLHPLVIHAAVVGIPLAVLLALLFVLPPTRRWARWPLLLTVLGATGATYVAKESGSAFFQLLKIQPGTPVGQLVIQHAGLANQLFWIMIGFSAVTVLAVAAVRAPRREPRSSDTPAAGQTAGGKAAGGKAFGRVLCALLLVVALVAGAWVFRVGDAGSRAVWNPDGARFGSN